MLKLALIVVDQLNEGREEKYAEKENFKINYPLYRNENKHFMFKKSTMDGISKF